MSRSLRTGLTLAFLVAAPALGGCATVYHPRPSARIAMVPEGGSVVLEKNGQIYSASAFSSGVEEAVQGNPRAEEEASSYRSLTVGGFVLGIVGGASAGAGAGILAYGAAQSGANNTTISGGLVAASVSLFVGGLVMGIIGNALQGNAHAHLYNAVNIYNDGVGGGYGPQPGWAPQGYAPVVPTYAPAYAPPPPPAYPPPGAPPSGAPGAAPPPPPAAPAAPPGAPPPLPAPAPLPH